MSVINELMAESEKRQTLSVYKMLRKAGYKAHSAMVTARTYVRAEADGLFVDYDYDDIGASDWMDESECNCDKRKTTNWGRDINHDSKCCFGHSHMVAILAEKDDLNIQPTYNYSTHNGPSNGRTTNGEGERIWGYSLGGICEPLVSYFGASTNNIEALADLAGEYYADMRKQAAELERYQWSLVEDMIA